MEENNIPQETAQESNQESVANNKGFNSMYIFGGLVLVGLVGVFMVTRTNKPSGVPLPTQNTPVESQAVQGTEASASSGKQNSVTVKEFTIDGSSFEFDPPSITVEKGDTVKITFKDNDGMHNLVIEGYNVKTNVIGPGKEETISFVADKTGSFRYLCTVGNHADLGMVGTLVVQ